MKVALTGSHGTGKTTLLSRLGDVLEARGQAAAICREVPRIIINEAKDDEFFRRGNNTLQRQLLIFFYQVIEEGILASKAPLVITDRTVVDHLAYCMELFPDFQGLPEGRALVSGVKSWLGQYDVIVKLPIEFPVKDDGVREGETEFQASIDRRLDDLYADAGVAPVVVSGTIEARTDAVLALIASKG